MTVTVVAVDVTGAARAAGATTPGSIALSAGLAGVLVHDGDQAAWHRALGELARAILEGANFRRRPLATGVELVLGPTGRRFVALRQEEAAGQSRTVILTAFEWALLDGRAFCVDVRAPAPQEHLQ